MMAAVVPATFELEVPNVFAGGDDECPQRYRHLMDRFQSQSKQLEEIRNRCLPG